MSEYQTYYNEVCQTGAWATNEPEECGCRGRGYWLSEVDTWHECPYHFEKGQPHPEDDLERSDFVGAFDLKHGALKVSFSPRGTHVKITNDDNCEASYFETRDDARKLYRRMLDHGWRAF